MNSDLLREVLSDKSLHAEALKAAKEICQAAWLDTQKEINNRETIMKPYKQPSIVGVLGALGTITFILGVGAILVTIGKHLDHSYLIAGAGSLISGLFLVACSSALDYLARGAHWAEQIASVAHSRPFLAGQTHYRGM